MANPSISEERREELGYDRLFLRPYAGTKKDLEELARRLNTSPSHAVSKAIEFMLASLPR